MANHKSALKRAKQTIKRNARNTALRSSVRTALKKYRALIDAKDKEQAQATLPSVYKKLDMAVTKGVMHKNNASRKKSRLTQALNKLNAA